jgi:catechol 2,3-dioxygenase-like lactoylglutathione lyase family enzyme
MIQKMSHATFFVLDQDVAHDFYVNKLGFEVKTDAPMGEGMRWLTVCPPGQPDLEIVLMGTKPNEMLDEETSSHIRWLLENTKMGAGVFSTADCKKTYEELKAKGVEFMSEPTEQFYGVEATFKDGCGNWFSLGQEKPH